METPRKFITAKLAVINLRGVSTNKTIILHVTTSRFTDFAARNATSLNTIKKKHFYSNI